MQPRRDAGSHWGWLSLFFSFLLDLCRLLLPIGRTCSKNRPAGQEGCNDRGKHLGRADIGCIDKVNGNPEGADEGRDDLGGGKRKALLPVVCLLVLWSTLFLD